MFFGHDGFGLPFRAIALCLVASLCFPSHICADGRKAKGVLLCLLGAASMGTGIAASHDKDDDDSDRRYPDRSDEIFGPSGEHYAPLFCALGAVSIIYGVVLLSKSSDDNATGSEASHVGESLQGADLCLDSTAPAAVSTGSLLEPIRGACGPAAPARVALGVAPTHDGVLAGVRVLF